LAVLSRSSDTFRNPTERPGSWKIHIGSIDWRTSFGNWLKSPTAGWDRKILIRSFRGTVRLAPEPPDPVHAEIQPGIGLIDRWERRRALTLPCSVERCDSVVVRVKLGKSAAATTSMSGSSLATSPVYFPLSVVQYTPRPPPVKDVFQFSFAASGRGVRIPGPAVYSQRLPAFTEAGAELGFRPYFLIFL
jgi:hypothetical protein